MDKVKKLSEAAKIVVQLKAQGKTVVSVVGVWDLFHAGHLHRLQEAKKQGDVLIVGVNTDEVVHTFKGMNRPIVAQAERVVIIKALECVDYVVLINTLRPITFLDTLKPSIHVNSPEYGTETLECETVRKHGGKVLLGTLLKDYSTSLLLSRIAELSQHQKKTFDHGSKDIK